MKTPHYLRFAQALLVAALPACSGPTDSKTVDPTTEGPAATQKSSVKAPAATEEAPVADPVAAPKPTEAPKPGAPTASAQADAGAHDASHNDASVDAELPFTSGPIVPPELPLGFV
jgi:hypothetical protein